jgi:HPt (histidine-containing phosphotransfer) domain-containing protein
VKCLEAGMNEHLGKPIRAAELSAALARVGAPAAAAIPAAPADARVFDAAALAMVRALPGSNGRSLLPEMISTYLTNEPGQLQRLALLARAHDGAIGDAAHHLAGGAGAFGAMAMRAQLLELEAIARRGDWPAVAAQLERVQVEAARLRAAVAQDNLLAE